ncbi:DMT family transporter [Hyphomicrobiales bacterium]|nr:DMT family transporter [Hyphomicrobiales bacterium]MDA9033946.1 DMT family transporter [Hyphomicrobiales bacterium]
MILISKIKGFLLLLIASLVWGSTFVPQKIAMDFWSPLQFTSFRFLLGGLILLLFINIKDIKINNKIGFISSSLASALILAIAALFQQIGIVTTSATNAGFYTSLYVIMVPLIGIFLFKIPHWSIWPCVIICFFGSVLLGTSDGDLFSLNLKYGDIWIISSAVFWAIHLHIVSYSVARFPVLIFSILQFILCGIFLLLYGIFFQISSIFSFERVDIFGFFTLVYCSVGSVCIGFTLQMFGQKLVPPTSAALIMSSEAIFAAIFGWLILSELLNFKGFFGASLILLGIILVQIIPRLKRL